MIDSQHRENWRKKIIILNIVVVAVIVIKKGPVNTDPLVNAYFNKALKMILWIGRSQGG